MYKKRELSDEMDFFIYLLEKYAEHSNSDAYALIKRFEAANIMDYIWKMYPMYHTECLENVFADIDKKLEEKQ